MKMQKYTAQDMRSALRKVRSEHGPDALILWTRRTAGVVELTVATDPEAVANAEILTQAARAAGADTVAIPVRSVSRPVAVPPAIIPPAVAGSAAGGTRVERPDAPSPREGCTDARVRIART